MLRFLRYGQKGFVALLVALIAAAFIFVLGIGGGPGDGLGAPGITVQVGERRYFPRDVLREVDRLDQRQREELGDDYDPDEARPRLESQAAESMLHRAIMAEEAERLGLDASTREIRNALSELPGATGAGGRLDQQRITNWAEQTYGSLGNMRKSFRDDILIIKMMRMIRGSVWVSDAEVRDSLRYQDESAKIVVLKIEPDPDSEDIEVSDEAALALAEAQPARVLESFEARRSEFEQEEEIEAKHILVEYDKDAGDDARAAAEQKLLDARARAEAGEDFAELAREISDGPSGESGGDLGRFGRGAMVPPFEEAAFALEAGELSEVVETNFGLHLIKLEAKHPALITGYEEARLEVAQDLLRIDAAEEAARALAQEIAGKIAAGETTLAEAAAEHDLVPLRPAPVKRSKGGNIAELGKVPELLDAAFSGAPGPRETLYDLPGGGYALLEVVERTAPEMTDPETALEQARERLLETRRNETLNAWLQSRRRALEASGDLVYDLETLR